MCRLLSVVRSLQYVVCRVLCVVCRVMVVVCCLPCVGYCVVCCVLSLVGGYWLFVVYWRLCVARHALSVVYCVVFVECCALLALAY